jgi:hypothetical protein
MAAHGASASAGNYVHRVCGDAAISDESGGWTPQLPSLAAGSTRAENRCASGGGLFAAVDPGGQLLSAGSGAGWRYSTPGGTKVAALGLDLEGWVTTYEGQSTQISVMADGSQVQHFDHAGGSTVLPPRRIGVTGIGANSVQLLVRCAEGPSCSSIYPLGHASFRDIAMTLTDDSAPVATEVTGALLTDSVVSGRQSVDIKASDTGGGLKELQVFVDGGLYAASQLAGGSCVASASTDGRWTFTKSRPCPLTVTSTSSFDLGQLADGSHEIVLKLVDAAGNSTPVYRGAKIVANNPPVNTALPTFARSDLAASPVLGEPLRAEAGSWSGPNLSYSYQWQRCGADGEQCEAIADATAPSYSPIRADEGKRLRVAVTARNVVAVTKLSPITGIVHAGKSGQSPGAGGLVNGAAAGGQACAGDSVRLAAPAVPKAKMSLRYRTRKKVRLRLMCTADGRPITGAVLQTSTHVPGRADAIPSRISTDKTGAATLALDGRSSRTILVDYRRNAADERPVVSLTLHVRVRGRITLSATKRGAAARFHGRVLGGRIPERGVALQLQWRDGSRWRPVAGITTDKRGRYRHLYRFSNRASGFRYAFRVVVTPGQTDYPFLPARSVIRRAGR